VSRWQEEKAERNRKALARLSNSLPTVFPSAVLARALVQPFIPPTPRLAVDSYWRAHPIRADGLARALAARSGAPKGWIWQLGSNGKSGLPATFRTPPAPYRERAYAKGPGFCCVCGQPVYRFGWHADLWGGANKNATWHCACVIVWQFSLWRAHHDRSDTIHHDPSARLGAVTNEPRLFACRRNLGAGPRHLRTRLSGRRLTGRRLRRRRLSGLFRCWRVHELLHGKLSGSLAYRILAQIGATNLNVGLDCAG
jgi:hypothetical protein